MTSVVVTGVGALTPLGTGFEALTAGVAEGRRAIRETERGPRAELPEIDVKAVLGAKGLRSIDRLGQLALVACHEALEHAGLDAPARADAIGVVLGTAFGGLASITGFYRERLADGPRLVTASNFGNIVMNAAASQVALRHGFTALNATLTSGCASGLDALGWALDLLRQGRAAALLAGGADELSSEALATLAALGWPAGGFVPAEAAVVWLLEREAEARARGGQVLARVLGHAAAFDPAPLLGNPPSASVLGSTIQRALAAAGTPPDVVALVAASGGGVSGLEDAVRQAIAAVTPAAPIISARDGVGDALAASGPIAGTLALARLATPDGPATALVVAASPSGHHAALVLARAQEAPR